jgi:hypothetical protein
MGTGAARVGGGTGIGYVSTCAAHSAKPTSEVAMFSPAGVPPMTTMVVLHTITTPRHHTPPTRVTSHSRKGGGEQQQHTRPPRALLRAVATRPCGRGPWPLQQATGRPRAACAAAVRCLATSSDEAARNAVARGRGTCGARGRLEGAPEAALLRLTRTSGHLPGDGGADAVVRQRQLCADVESGRARFVC